MVFKAWTSVKKRKVQCAAGACAEKELSILQFGFVNDSVRTDIIHEAASLLYFFCSDYFLPTSFVVLHRGSPNVAVLPDVIEVSVLPTYFLTTYFSSHVFHLPTAKIRRYRTYIRERVYKLIVDTVVKPGTP